MRVTEEKKAAAPMRTVATVVNVELPQWHLSAEGAAVQFTLNGDEGPRLEYAFTRQELEAAARVLGCTMEAGGARAELQDRLNKALVQVSLLEEQLQERDEAAERHTDGIAGDNMLRGNEMPLAQHQESALDELRRKEGLKDPDFRRAFASGTYAAWRVIDMLHHKQLMQPDRGKSDEQRRILADKMRTLTPETTMFATRDPQDAAPFVPKPPLTPAQERSAKRLKRAGAPRAAAGRARRKK